MNINQKRTDNGAHFPIFLKWPMFVLFIDFPLRYVSGLLRLNKGNDDDIHKINTH